MLALLPTAQVRQLILYLLFLCAQRHGVTLYAMVVMFNHYHLLGNDRSGAFPAFMQDFNSMLAKALNVILVRKGKLWSGDGFVPTYPQSSASMLDRLRYIYGNPLEANLVSRVDDYPHLLIRPQDIGRDLVAERPDHPFFNDNPAYPAQLHGRFEVPPEFAELGVDGYRELLESVCVELEAENRERRERDGVAVVGAKRLRAHREWRRVPESSERWFRLRPQIAERDKALRIAAIRLLQSFREAYREALRRYNEGELDVEFPYGTWKMRTHGVCVADPPDC